MERSMEMFARGDLFVDSAKWNGKSRGTVVFLHRKGKKPKLDVWYKRTFKVSQME